MSTSKQAHWIDWLLSLAILLGTVALIIAVVLQHRISPRSEDFLAGVATVIEVYNLSIIGFPLAIVVAALRWKRSSSARWVLYLAVILFVALFFSFFFGILTP